ncbi:MFS transporter [Polyangium jinanense]|uniref:MFS transporter n=1 Tax=Polyangium jinanense TaxID=2829994 RepID=A0A9X3XD29_9BACT|nr:MFS transporter [Polyangium jinanense]MDC3956973.1 MFS transporter [Polyangium jinanense]MDC3987130.1 MFS transporter [Polyangium jinanense]
MTNSSTKHRPVETLLIVGTASVLSSLDLFVVNIAFSSIKQSFADTTNQALSWVLSAYSILFAAMMIPAGRLADRYGRKRVFRLGLVVFGVASAACALAPSVSMLILARAVKGIGAAMMVPTSLGLVLAAYPREKHTQMVGVWAATGAVAAALGPVVGGALVHLDWRLIFLINVPFVAVATWRSKELVDTAYGGADVPDLLGSSLLALGIGAIVAAISYAPDWGALSPSFLVTSSVGVVLLAWFVRRCRTSASPALDLRLFRIPTFAVATIGMGCFYIGFAMMLLGGTLFLTSVWQWDTLVAGAGFAWGPATAAVTALVAGRLSVPPRYATIVGGGLFVLAAFWWYALLDQVPTWTTHFLPASLLFGAAAGIAQTGFLAGGTASLPASEYATGTAILNTARQLGGAVGVALFVALTGTATLASQYAPAWLAIACFGLVTCLSAFALRAHRAAAPA